MSYTVEGLLALVLEYGTSIRRFDFTRRLEDDAREKVESIRAYATALSNPPDGWKPISTAPKDGAQYILVTAGRGAWVAHWCPLANSGYRFDQPWRSVMLNHYHIAPAARYLPPTHWMPLPPPPNSVTPDPAGSNEMNPESAPSQPQGSKT